MRKNKSGAIGIFLGLLLTAAFTVGLIAVRDPAAFIRKDSYDYTLEFAVNLCKSIWLPAGVIGIPLFLVSLIRSLYLESKEKDR
jgi:hypothetical protein